MLTKFEKIKADLGCNTLEMCNALGLSYTLTMRLCSGVLGKCDPSTLDKITAMGINVDFISNFGKNQPVSKQMYIDRELAVSKIAQVRQEKADGKKLKYLMGRNKK